MLNKHEKLSNIKAKPTEKSQMSIKDTTGLNMTRQSSQSIRFRSNRNLSEIDLEKETVENLNYWNYNKKTDHLKRMNTARLDLEKKLSNQDIVQKYKRIRKGLDISPEKALSFKEKCKIYQKYEEECFEVYRDMEENLLKLLENRDNLRKSIINLMEEKNKHSGDLKLHRKIAKHPSRKIFSPRMKQAEIAVYLSSVQTLKKSSSKEKYELIQHIEMLEIDIKNKSREITQVDEAIEELRKAIKITKNNILKHYLEILKQGTDTRGEGLYTIIKSLILLGVELKTSMFPSVLDDVSIENIIKIAEKSLELESLREKFEIIKSEKNLNAGYKEDIKNRLAKLKKTLKTRKPDYSNKKNKWQHSYAIDLQEDHSDHMLSESVKCEEKIQALKHEIHDIQVKEIKRLAKDCLKNGKNLKEIVCYIVGIDNIEKFMVYTNKEIKEIKAAKEKTRTFKFSAKLLPERNLAQRN